MHDGGCVRAQADPNAFVPRITETLPFTRGIDGHSTQHIAMKPQEGCMLHLSNSESAPLQAAVPGR